MQVYPQIAEIEPIGFPVVTSGTFDGVHIGHQKILKRLKEIAHRHQGESVVITYWPHPRIILHPESTNLKLLNTLEEKTSLIAAEGIDHLIKIPFTKEFSQWSSEDFIQKILVQKIGTKKLVIGYDHRFGKNREGGFEYLSKNAPNYGFEVEEIPRQDIDEIGVSSTKIRKALTEGNVALSNEYLGRPYSLRATVVEGNKIGREIGFPTANLSTDPHKLIPGDGVYAVKVSLGEESYGGMLNIGFRPTISGTQRIIEVNIFDFDRDIYGATLTVHFYQCIRKEIKFEGLDALKTQLSEDKSLALKFLGLFSP